MLFDSLFEMDTIEKTQQEFFITNDYIVGFGQMKFNKTKCNTVSGHGATIINENKISPKKLKENLYLPTKYNNIKNTKGITNKLQSGDKTAGPSKPFKKPIMKSNKVLEKEKLKPNQIYNNIEDKDKTKSNDPAALETLQMPMKPQKQYRKLLMNPTTRKMQLINHDKQAVDVHSKLQVESNSATKTKMLLEKLRLRNNMGSDRLNEWLMEYTTEHIKPPANSFATNISTTIIPQVSRSHVIKRTTIDKKLMNPKQAQNEVDNTFLRVDIEKPLMIDTGSDNLDTDIETDRDVKTNDKVTERTMLHQNEIIKLKKPTGVSTINQIFENCKLRTKEYLKAKSPRNKIEAGLVGKEMPKIDHKQTIKTETNTNENDPTQYDVVNSEVHNDTVSRIISEISDKVPQASYIECPSEILQRMTNLEGYDIISSITETDIEFAEDFSSNYNTEQIDSSLIESRSENWTHLDSCIDSLSSDDRKRFPERYAFKICSSQIVNRKCIKDVCDSRDYHHHYCWRREVAKRYSKNLWDCTGRCKKCQKTRNKQNRVPKSFVIFTKRISVGRICRRRWNIMWKSTTERWASKPKLQSKLKKLTTLLDLQRSIFWENADAQTTVLLYHETGTDAVAKEQKSAAIEAPVKLLSEACTKIESVTANNIIKFRNKQANVGPSMFLFAENIRSNLVASKKYGAQHNLITFNPFISNQLKINKNNITTSIVPLRTLLENKDSDAKENHKTLKPVNSKSIYSFQVDRAIETDGSLILITKNRSSMSTTSDLAKVLSLNLQHEGIQTEEVTSAETHTYVNYNQSMEIDCSSSSSSFDVNFYKPCGTNTDPILMSQRNVGINTSNSLPVRLTISDLSALSRATGKMDSNVQTSLKTTGTQLNPKSSFHKLSEMKSLSEITDDVSPTFVTADTNILATQEKSGNTSPVKSDDTIIFSVLSNSANKLISDTSIKLNEPQRNNKSTEKSLIDLDKETSRYLCRRQYGTSTNAGTKTGSSFLVVGVDKNTTTNESDPSADIALSTPNLTEITTFHGGPARGYIVHMGVSTEGLIQRYSFSCGSHHSQCSFTANTRPEYVNVCTSMVQQMMSKCTGIKCSLVNQQDTFDEKSDSFTQNESIEGRSTNRSRSDDSPNLCKDTGIQANIDSDMKPQRMLSSSVGVFTSIQAACQSVQTAYGMLEKDAETGTNLAPPASTGTVTSYHVTAVSVQTPIILLKRDTSIQSSDVLSGTDSLALTKVEQPLRGKKINVKKSTRAMKIHTFIQCHTVTTRELLNSASNENIVGECRRDKICDMSNSNTLSTMIDKITTTDKELKCIKQELNSNIRNTATSMNSNVKKNIIYKAEKSPPTPPRPSHVDNNKYGGGTAKDCLFVYDAPRFIVRKSKTDASAQVLLSQGLKYETNKPVRKKVRNVGLRAVVHEASVSYNDYCSDSLCRTLQPSEPIMNQTSLDQSKIGAKISNIATKDKMFKFNDDHRSRKIQCVKPSCLYEQYVGVKIDSATQTSSKERFNLNEAIGLHTGSTDESVYEPNSKHRPDMDRSKKCKALKCLPSIGANEKRCVNSSVLYMEECTMKPSGFRNAGCQTVNVKPAVKFASTSARDLSSTLSRTAICGHRDKEDLKSLYYILTAIEGRIKKIKRNVYAR